MESTAQAPAHEPSIDPASLSPAAVQVTRRLQDQGYEAYLVGGCVRDLLLGGHPKDYDVATNATPEQVKQVFRRARIVGRRFKIVHVREGREMIEVTTFRRAHDSEDDVSRGVSGRILDDNEYGDLESDALRRDFTINALYYDPTENEGIDLTDGLADLEHGVLRIIGFVNGFAGMRDYDGRLSFRPPDPATEAAVRHSIHLLSDIPPARLFDEVLKLFHHGFGLPCGRLLMEYKVLHILFPVLKPYLGESDMPRVVQRALENTDHRVRQDKPVIAAFLFAALLWPELRRRMEDDI